MISEKFFLCAPYDFHGKCHIFPPKVKDIIANDKFWVYYDILTKTQEEIGDMYEEEKEKHGLKFDNYPTPFEFLLMSAFNNKEVASVIQDAFQFFIHQEVTFLYEVKMILIGDIKQELKAVKDINQLNFIKEEDFFEFQNAIRQAMGQPEVKPPVFDKDPRVRHIKAMGRWRERLKTKKSGGTSFFTSLVAICCMNMGINPLNIGELSYSAVKSLIAMYQQQEESRMDIDTLLAGGDSKKIKPKYWIRDPQKQ